MERRAGKELLHIEGWLARVDEIVRRGKDAYLTDALLQEAGDSLMATVSEQAESPSKSAMPRRLRTGFGCRRIMRFEPFFVDFPWRLAIALNYDIA